MSLCRRSHAAVFALALAVTVFAGATIALVAASVDVDSCPADGCGPSLQHTSVPCLMDDMACLGLVGDAVPKKGVVKPRVSRSTKDMFDRAQAQRDFKDAIEWLDKHQFPCDCSKPKLFPVQHPRGDGDGYGDEDERREHH